MSTGIAVQPVAGIALTELARPAAVASQGAVPTELPAAKAVNALPEAAPAHNARPSSNSGTTDIARNFVIDPQTQDVVYRVMDVRTRQVLYQVPDAAQLRRAAYARAQAVNAKNTATVNQTNILG
jgi:hypothetical protein